MPLVRKRRVRPPSTLTNPKTNSIEQVNRTDTYINHKQNPDPDEEIYASSPAGPSTQQAPRRRRRETQNTQADSDTESAADSSDDDNEDEDGTTHAPSSTDVMVKKLVRLVLASEYSRQVVRRTDISAKVLGEQGTRQFKAVFQGAQKALQERFGMQMVELPGKEKVTISQRRGEFRPPMKYAEGEKECANT